ncbi:hypothetical protein R6Q59_008002 [Mikania micrantha]
MVLSKAYSSESDVSLHSTFASRYVRTSLPRFKIPENSIPKEAAYQIINDELMLDGNPRLNLASFVTTWMEPECDRLIMAAINKNYVDMDEYPVTTELQVMRTRTDGNHDSTFFNATIGDTDKLRVGSEPSVEMVDETPSGCCAAILGSTLNGEFEDVKVKRLYVRRCRDRDGILRFQLDAASGGFMPRFFTKNWQWESGYPW